MELKEKIEQGLKQAIASRGKNKGMLKAKCPPVNTYGSAVWLSLIAHSNPNNVEVKFDLFMDSDKKEVYKYIMKCDKHLDLTTFDTDANLLRALRLM